MATVINYDNRDFKTLYEGLLNYVKQNHPEVYGSINDSSIGSVILELNAAVGSMLSFNTDRMFQETQLFNAQERKNILAIAKNLGYKEKGKATAISVVDFKVNVPPDGESFNSSYLPILRPGTQVTGAGKIFETVEDIDFSSDLSANGTPNRTIEPIRASDGTVTSYRITKRELVYNGETKILRRVITDRDVKPFLQIVLPEGGYNVVSVEQVISLDGNNFTTEPSINDFLNDNNRWYEVDSLAEEKIFIMDSNTPVDENKVPLGKWVVTDKKFIVDYNDNGFCRLTFGSGAGQGTVIDATSFLDNIIFNNALGIAPRANTTLFIRYRIGGGASANVGANVLRNVGNVNMLINGADPQLNEKVKNSLVVNNPLPAFGGGEEMGTEEIRNFISYNFSAQNRAVTTRDYLAQIMRMPGKFGRPFRAQVHEIKNKIQIYTLYLDANGKLSNTSTSQLLSNIANWLEYYRLINDYINITDGKIYNLSIDVFLQIDKQFSKSEIAANVINLIKDQMNITKKKMGDHLYVGQLKSEIMKNINGVLNITEIKIYNKVGVGGINDYSINEVSQEYIDDITKEIKLIDDTLWCNADGMFEIKFPEKDIRVFIK